MVAVADWAFVLRDGVLCHEQESGLESWPSGSSGSASVSVRLAAIAVTAQVGAWQPHDATVSAPREAGVRGREQTLKRATLPPGH
ncbi:hypothetical protein AAFF_G00056870 [Aldrovandia affinis]|uniref:Uncharacterized protein n=1 Tax=Aldrovandia affinis TaxID=143900 RepID=A0AAD7S103_9TELE|nr:hypothetical protein AAFF_G00056870 [Aldrovandia affinis]